MAYMSVKRCWAFHDRNSSYVASFYRKVNHFRFRSSVTRGLFYKHDILASCVMSVPPTLNKFISSKSWGPKLKSTPILPSVSGDGKLWQVK